jgi:hypothetical protein
MECIIGVVLGFAVNFRTRPSEVSRKTNFYHIDRQKHFNKPFKWAEQGATRG